MSTTSSPTQIAELSRARPQGEGGLVLPILITLMVFAVGLLGLYAPPETGEMAVIFPVGQTEAGAVAAIVAAGGGYVGPSRLPNVFVAYADDENFKQLIREQGALIFLAATGLCAVDITREDYA